MTSAVADPAAAATAAEAWKEFTPDPAKSADENAAAKTAHDATKPSEPAPAAAAFTPIEFAKDIKLPAGFAPDDATATEFTGIINDPKLSRQEMAQKLVDLQAKNLSGLSEKGKTDWENLQNTWKEDASKDPVIGGDKLPVATANIGRLLDTYSSEQEDKGLGIRAVFDLTGAGNHPQMIRFLNWIGSKLNEGAPLASPSPGNGGVNPASVMFPSMTK